MRTLLSCQALCLMFFLSTGFVLAEEKEKPKEAKETRKDVNTVTLKIEGDVETIVIVKSLPCKVVAPSGYDFYTWDYPDGVKANVRRASLTFSSTLTITESSIKKFKVLVSGLKQKEKETMEGEVTVNLGEVKPPEPDLSDLGKSIKKAYDADTDPSKGKHMRALAEVYTAGASVAEKGEAKTVGALYKAMEAGAAAAGIKGKITGVQTVVASYIEQKKLPRTSSTPIDDKNRTLIVTTLREIATALRDVVP